MRQTVSWMCSNGSLTGGDFNQCSYLGSPDLYGNASFNQLLAGAEGCLPLDVLPSDGWSLAKTQYLWARVLPGAGAFMLRVHFGTHAIEGTCTDDPLHSSSSSAQGVAAVGYVSH